ncbi:hypothetical protein ACIFQM_00840 [Paenibacillus sp. NRS-1782]|uniref:hypothetical protein n=1 Tax=unclassified Paenibacillus TaxID=185978 RepID=UPI003D278869
MSMDFVVFQIGTADDLTPREGEFYKFLSNFPRQEEDRGLHFCITNDLSIQNSIITGNISQEHLPLTDSVDEEKAVYAPEDIPSLHTFFAIDLQEKFLLIQYRDYSPKTLDKDVTRNRLSRVLNAAFIEVYHQQINLIPTEKEYDEEELLRLFNEYRVSYLRVRIGEHRRLLRDEAKIFDDPSLNDNWIQAWNEDASNTNVIILKAPGQTGEGDLRTSPLAKTLLSIPSKDIEELIYWDRAGRQNKVNKSGFKRFKVNDIDLYTHPITAIDYISAQISQRRSEIELFRIDLGL